MSDTKVYLLDGGTLVIDGYHAFWNRGPGGEIRFPCYAVLIEHEDGRYMFDTGYDFDHVMRVLPFEKPIQDAAQTIPGQLAKLGLKTSDINYVINSHYHFDHCGGNKHLHEACTICHAKELEASGNCQPFEHLGYSDLTFSPEIAKQKGVQLPPDPALDMYTPKFQTLTGDQEIAKGLWLFETPGHTAGHYSLMVELKGRRPMLFTADACYSKKSMDMMCISSFHLDPVASLQVDAAAEGAGRRSTMPSSSIPTISRASRATRRGGLLLLTRLAGERHGSRKAEFFNPRTGITPHRCAMGPLPLLRGRGKVALLYQRTMPASTLSAWPVIQWASSEARKATAGTISVGRPRPLIACSMSTNPKASLWGVVCTPSVSVRPGQTELTVIL